MDCSNHRPSVLDSLQQLQQLLRLRMLQVHLGEVVAQLQGIVCKRADQ